MAGAQIAIILTDSAARPIQSNSDVCLYVCDVTKHPLTRVMETSGQKFMPAMTTFKNFIGFVLFEEKNIKLIPPSPKGTCANHPHPGVVETFGLRAYS